MVVDGFAAVVARITGVVCLDAVLDELAVFLFVFEHLVCRVEREELTLVGRIAHFVNAPGVIDVEGILISVVGCVVFGAVIDVVAVLNLEEARHAKMGRLAGLGRGIEQVAEGLAAPGFGKLRVAAEKRLVDNVLLWSRAARPMVERPITLAVVKLELVACVDAAAAGNRQMVIGIHPVIKQVDCCPRRRNRRNRVVRKRNRVVRNRRLRAGRQEETRRQHDGEGQNNHIWRDRAQPATTAIRHDGPPLARPMSTKKFPAGTPPGNHIHE